MKSSALVIAIALAALSAVVCPHFAGPTGFSEGELKIIPWIVLVLTYGALSRLGTNDKENSSESNKDPIVMLSKDILKQDEEYSQDAKIVLTNCPHCKAEGILPMAGNKCPNCKKEINGSIPFKNTNYNLSPDDNTKRNSSKSPEIAGQENPQCVQKSQPTKPISKTRIVFFFPFACIFLFIWIALFFLGISTPFNWIYKIELVIALPLTAFSVLVIIGIVKSFCFLFSKDPEKKYKGADGVCTFGVVGLIFIVAFSLVAVIIELFVPSRPKNNKISNTVNHTEVEKKNDKEKSYAQVSHFEYEGIAFDYPSTLSTPDKNILDIEKVRKMISPSGVEIVTIVMSPDMNTMIQVARTKGDISFDALYEEKNSLAVEINRGGVNVMGEQYTKFTVEKILLSGDVQALIEHGEKANGEVAINYEFINNGYDYGIMFIYKSSSHMQAGVKDREKVIQSVNIKRVN